MLARVLEGGDDLTALVAKLDKVGDRVIHWKATGPATGKYVQKLPDLLSDPAFASFAKSFEGHIFQGELKPGDIIYQLQRAGQTEPGDFFLAVRPIDSSTGEALANIAQWNNHGDKLVTYVVKEPVTVYAGSIFGAEGHQIAFPMRDLFKDRPLPMRWLEQVEEVRLPFKAVGE